MNFESNPFMMLTFIAAPALLTNSCALLAMSTSNRVARAVDRAKEVSRQIESDSKNSSDIKRLSHELTKTEERGLLLMKSLRSIYWSLGAFALVTLVSLIGAALSTVIPSGIGFVMLCFMVIIGSMGVCWLIYTSILLLHETQIVVGLMHERIKSIKLMKGDITD